MHTPVVGGRESPVRTIQRRRLARVRHGILVAACIAVAFACLELLLQALLSHPQAIPSAVIEKARQYYLWDMREIVQFKPDCARFDETLFYTLRPGSCRFSSPEFDTTIKVNSRGLRDEESALQAPEIIVVGDSFAMGWGVEGPETFPARIESLSGRKTLNAGIPSYGTAREMLLYSSLDRSNLRYLVVQYSDNDLGENLKFLEQRNHLPTSSRARYEEMTELSALASRYYFGKHAGVLLPLMLGRQQRQGRLLSLLFQEEGDPSGDPFQPVKAFLGVLFAFARELEGVRVIVLNIPPRGQAERSIVDPLRSVMAANPTNALLVRLDVLDLNGKLGTKDYFILDDHLRASGHDAIARGILPLLEAREEVHSR